MVYVGSDSDDDVADGGDCERAKGIDEDFFDSDGSSSDDSDGIDANDGEQLQQPQITGAAKEQRTKSIDKDWTYMLCMELDLGLELGSCSRGGDNSDDGGDISINGGDGSGCGDGSSSGVGGGE